MKLEGTIVEETTTRLVLQSGGAFYSLPKSAVSGREPRHDDPP